VNSKTADCQLLCENTRFHPAGDRLGELFFGFPTLRLFFQHAPPNMSLSSVIKNLVSLLPLLTLQDTDGKMAMVVQACVYVSFVPQSVRESGYIQRSPGAVRFIAPYTPASNGTAYLDNVRYPQ
jgi:hypothetical protein